MTPSSTRATLSGGGEVRCPPKGGTGERAVKRGSAMGFQLTLLVAGVLLVGGARQVKEPPAH